MGRLSKLLGLQSPVGRPMPVAVEVLPEEVFVPPQITDPGLYDVKRIIKACRQQRDTDIKCYNMVDDPDVCLYHYVIDVEGNETHEFHLPFSETSVRMHTTVNTATKDKDEFTKQIFCFFTIDNCMRQQYDNLRYGDDGVPRNRMIMFVTTNSVDTALQTFLGRMTSACQGLDMLFEKIMIKAQNKNYTIAL